MILPLANLFSGACLSSEADPLNAYPTLRAEDLANAWAFSRGHREEIQQQILENEAA